MFWKEVKRVRKGGHIFGGHTSSKAREEMVKDVNCQILRYGVEERRRCAEYIKHAGPECRICQGGKYQCSWHWRMPVLGDSNE